MESFDTNAFGLLQLLATPDRVMESSESLLRSGSLKRLICVPPDLITLSGIDLLTAAGKKNDRTHG
jgi:hypothetical protein